MRPLARRTPRRARRRGRRPQGVVPARPARGGRAAHPRPVGERRAHRRAGRLPAGGRARRGRRRQGRRVRRDAGAAEDLRVGSGLRHPARRADDPRARARCVAGRAAADRGDPVPRLPPQRRGPAARRGGDAGLLLRRAVRQRDGRPDRVAGLAQGLRRALPQRQRHRRAARHPGHRRRLRLGPAEAPELLRTLAGLALGEGRVGVLLEPTALYHDKAETAPYAAPEDWQSTTATSAACTGAGARRARGDLRQRGRAVAAGDRADRRRTRRSSTCAGWRRCRSCTCSRSPRPSRGCWSSTRRGARAGCPRASSRRWSRAATAARSRASPPRTPSSRSAPPPPTWCSPRTTSWLR